MGLARPALPLVGTGAQLAAHLPRHPDELASLLAALYQNLAGKPPVAGGTRWWLVAEVA